MTGVMARVAVAAGAACRLRPPGRRAGCAPRAVLLVRFAGAAGQRTDGSGMTTAVEVTSGAARVGDAPPWPTVSVVVPTRDRPQLLPRAVGAILDQRYPGSIECLVVYDQTEPKLPWGGALPSGRAVRVIANGRTPGLAGARNAGALAADGALLAFCDDDDQWLPDKLVKQVRALRAYPDVAVATTGILVHYRRRTIPRVTAAPFVAHRDLLRSRVTELHPSTFLVRRQAFFRIGLVDEQLPGSYAEDYDWLLRAARRSPILAVQEPLVHVHWHRSSFFADRWATIAAACRYLLDKHPELCEEPRGLARIYGQIAFASAASGDRPAAWAWARRALALSHRERRAYLALAVALRLVSPGVVTRLAHTFGKGV